MWYVFLHLQFQLTQRYRSYVCNMHAWSFGQTVFNSTSTDILMHFLIFLSEFSHELTRPWLKKEGNPDHWWIMLNSFQNPQLELEWEFNDFSHHIVVNIWPRTFWNPVNLTGATVWRVKILTAMEEFRVNQHLLGCPRKLVNGYIVNGLLLLTYSGVYRGLQPIY